MNNRWDSSDRKDFLPDNWESEIRPRIFERDSYRCCSADTEGRRCMLPATEVDHIVPHYLGGTDDDENLASICTPHHRAKSSQEGHTARAEQRAKRLRPRRPHPGSIPKGGNDDARAN